MGSFGASGVAGVGEPWVLPSSIAVEVEEEDEDIVVICSSWVAYVKLFRDTLLREVVGSGDGN